MYTKATWSRSSRLTLHVCMPTLLHILAIHNIAFVVIVMTIVVTRQLRSFIIPLCLRRMYNPHLCTASRCATWMPFNKVICCGGSDGFLRFYDTRAPKDVRHCPHLGMYSLALTYAEFNREALAGRALYVPMYTFPAVIHPIMP